MGFYPFLTMETHKTEIYSKVGQGFLSILVILAEEKRYTQLSERHQCRN
jgi:hypothetical protein